VVLANFDPILIEAVGVVIATCAKCGTNGIVTRGAW
jgi:hypothetical protein